MANYKTKDFEAALVQKGFQEDETHHSMYWYYIDGHKSSVRTRTSQGETDFGDTLFSLRQQQLHLTKQQMLDFISCPLTGDLYRTHLLNTGHVRLPTPPIPTTTNMGKSASNKRQKGKRN